ncbi:MAG: 2-amino-4-hydroxy-6-hydroxymethyldihydropteridine diphosphokinase [Crocinitomicaceae bacterium]
MGTIVYLSLGSNLGDRAGIIREALQKIDARCGTLEKVSKYYETEPWGFETDQQFLNICASITTSLSPSELLKTLQSIEKELGRKRVNQLSYTSRTIDIDIISFGQSIVENIILKVPHPEFIHRNFVLIPLLEIAPNFIHPKTAKTIQQIIASCMDETSVVVYENK